MSLKKILMKGTTRMSLHDRFTFLRHQPGGGESSQTVHIQSVRQGLFGNQQPATVQNRRLAAQMDRRPTVIAALRLKKRLLKQRLGQVQRPGLSVKDRLTLRGKTLRGRVGQRGSSMGRSPLSRQPRIRGARGNRRGGRGNFSRSESFNNLSRSQSIQSLNGRRNYSTGDGSGGGGFRSRGRGRFQNRNIVSNQEFRRGSRGRGFRARGGFRNRDDFRGRRGGSQGRFNSRGTRSRGGFRGRGRGRGAGPRGTPPTREELDSQLDQYMAGSRGVLDRELDHYMTQDVAWD